MIGLIQYTLSALLGVAIFFGPAVVWAVILEHRSKHR